jgi:L-fucose isomerase-like protein
LNAQKDFEFDPSGEVVFFIETGGTEEEFKSIYERYKEPYFILATDANNSLPASLEIATFLRQKGKKFKVFHGKPEEVREQLKSAEFPKIPEKNRGFLNFSCLKGMRLGVVGKPSDWLISSDVNYKEVKEKFSVDLVDVSTEEFLEKVRTSKPKLDPVMFEPLLNEKVDHKTLEGALQIYGALRDIIVEHNLNGVTVRCFDLLTSVHNTSCLALAMLNKDGYIATCEGDVPAMLSMAIIKKAFHQSSFQVNPSYLNLEKRFGYFAHCTLPLDMCLSYEFDTHFESGIGLGVKGRLNLGKVTIFKMNANLKDYEVFEGQIVENLYKNNLCRTQVKVQFSEPIDEMFTSPNGNHLLIFFGAHKDELVKILSN